VGKLALRSIFKWLDKRIGRLDIAPVKDYNKEDVWTLSQQKALERALADYPATLGKQKRWLLIGKSVPGKDVTQCVNRFNKIRQEVLKKREKAKALRQEQTEKVRLEVEKLSGSLKTMDTNDISGKDVSDSASKLLDFSLPKKSEDDFDAHTSEKFVFEDLRLNGIGWMFVNRISIVGACIGCGNTTNLDLESGKENKQWCAGKKCSKLLNIVMDPVLIHESNLRKGFLIITDSVAIQDITRISSLVSCFECGSHASVSDIVRGRITVKNCFECHNAMRIFFQDVLLQGLSTQVESRQQKVFKRKQRRDPRIVPGKPLPNEGTCKHYRKSHRWLRFPCCGRAFPCDVCHELEAACPETKWATRQICGYCAKEQPFSKDKPCLKCGKTIGTTKSTSHWEGGKGQRNQEKMSSKDRKKYSNSSKKTASNKHNRVGNAKKKLQAKAKKQES